GLPLLVTCRGSGSLSPVVERDGVPGLGEEQPALDQDAQAGAEARRDGSERRGESIDQEGEAGQRERETEGEDQRNTTQPRRMPPRDPKAHLAKQIIFFGVGRLEQSDPPERAETGRRLRRARRPRGIDEAPVAKLGCE